MSPRALQASHCDLLCGEPLYEHVQIFHQLVELLKGPWNRDGTYAFRQEVAVAIAVLSGRHGELNATRCGMCRRQRF